MEQFEQGEVDQLRAGAECRIHYHPKDFPDINDLINLEAVNPGIVVSADAQLGNTETLVPVDTSAGDVTLTLPPPADGREYQIIKTSALYTLYIVPTAGDTVLGSATGVSIVLYGTCLHLKAVTDNDWMAI